MSIPSILFFFFFNQVESRKRWMIEEIKDERLYVSFACDKNQKKLLNKFFLLIFNLLNLYKLTLILLFCNSQNSQLHKLTLIFQLHKKLFI
jgi:hypothetical protein